MLGKTANGIFWMARYLERAENTARLIETGQRIALTRLQDNDDEWASILQSSGTLASFQEQHDELNKDAALDWMLRSTDNPSSIKSCTSTTLPLLQLLHYEAPPHYVRFCAPLEEGRVHHEGAHQLCRRRSRHRQRPRRLPVQGPDLRGYRVRAESFTF